MTATTTNYKITTPHFSLKRVLVGVVVGLGFLGLAIIVLV